MWFYGKLAVSSQIGLVAKDSLGVFYSSILYLLTDQSEYTMVYQIQQFVFLFQVFT